MGLYAKLGYFCYALGRIQPDLRYAMRRRNAINAIQQSKGMRVVPGKPSRAGGIRWQYATKYELVPLFFSQYYICVDHELSETKYSSTAFQNE